MSSPTIDVIIAVYNGEKFIQEAIESIQSQSWENLNIILADDGSMDSTLSIIRELSTYDPRIKILSLPHKGVSATLNAAIHYSTAPYIAFLDADDLWKEEKLEKQMTALEENKVDICFCLVQEFETLDQTTSQTHRARKEPIKGFSKASFLGKREVFDTYGLFDEEVAIGDFVEWFSRAVRAQQTYVILDEVLALRRVHAHNTTRSAPKNAFLGLLKKHLDEKRTTLE